MAGTVVIQACKAMDRFQTQFLRRIDDSNAAHYMLSMCQRWLTLRFNFLGDSLLFCTSLSTVLSKGTISPNLIGFILTNTNSLIRQLKLAVTQQTTMETHIVAVERIHEYRHLASEAEWDKPDVQLPEDWPQRGRIVFNNYSTRYREGLDLALKDVNLTIDAGEKVGIVGRTGAGKSSLTLAVFRLLEAVSGEIVVDGVDLAQLGLREVRSRLTIIPQEPLLFSGTLRLNLDPFSAHPDHELHSALRHAHLHHFTQSLYGGLDHPVSEAGSNFSVGQRQLVCLARALLRRTKILVLDEATASVDLDTDQLIQDTIRERFADCTVITIAHRLNTIMDYDRVMVLEQGSVVEFDSPVNLLENEQSLFRNLAKDANLSSAFS